MRARARGGRSARLRWRPRRFSRYNRPAPVSFPRSTSVAVVTTSYPSSEEDPAGHFVKAEVEELERDGHRVTVITPDAGGAFGWPGAAFRLREKPWRAFEMAGWMRRASLAAPCRAARPGDRSLGRAVGVSGGDLLGPRLDPARDRLARRRHPAARREPRPRPALGDRPPRPTREDVALRLCPAAREARRGPRRGAVGRAPRDRRHRAEPARDARRRRGGARAKERARARGRSTSARAVSCGASASTVSSTTSPATARASRSSS